MTFPNREEKRRNSLISSKGRKKEKFPFQQNEEKRGKSLFNKMKKKGFKKGNFISLFQKPFWKIQKRKNEMFNFGKSLMTMEEVER